MSEQDLNDNRPLAEGNEGSSVPSTFEIGITHTDPSQSTGAQSMEAPNEGSDESAILDPAIRKVIEERAGSNIRPKQESGGSNGSAKAQGSGEAQDGSKEVKAGSVSDNNRVSFFLSACGNSIPKEYLLGSEDELEEHRPSAKKPSAVGEIGAIAVGNPNTISTTTHDVSFSGVDLEDAEHPISTTKVQARLVADEEDAEQLHLDNQKLRKRLEEMENAPTAMVVSEDGSLPSEAASSTSRKRTILTRVLLILVLIVAVVVVASLAGTGAFQKGDKETPSSPWNNTTVPTGANNKSTVLLQPTLQTVKERGHIRCRVSPTDHKRGYGISLELCRALSAAIFGDPNQTDFHVTPLIELWDGVDTGRFDIGSSWATNHIGRDVHEAVTTRPKSFSTPFFFTGVRVAGRPDFVECADRGDALTGICKDLVICVVEGSSTSLVVQNHFDGTVIHTLEHSSETFVELAQGTCNVVAGKPQYIHEERALDAGYIGEYLLGSTFLSREPQAMVLREDDPQWTDFTSSVLQALFTAEMEGISKENATLFPQTTLFGEDFKNMYRQAVAAVGNWGDVFNRTFGQTTERRGMNLLNQKGSEGGLLYSAPFSALKVDPPPQDGDNIPGHRANGTLEAISSRGRLRCGIVPDRPGFAVEVTPINDTNTKTTWTGMDIDLCQCLAAALFGDPTLVELVVVEDHIAGFLALAEDIADVFAGATYSLKADIREPTINQGYTFSPSYFYGEDGEMLALATNQNATQWSDFVRWIIYALIYAEEQSIGTEDASMMPAVDLFGPTYKLMFRLIVLHFGNYGNLYDSNIGDLIPRRGSNLLNDGATPLINPLPIQQYT